MGVFLYTASDRSGSITKGEVEARSKAAASRKLSSQGLFVLEIAPAPARAASPKPELESQSVRQTQAEPQPVRPTKPPRVDPKPAATIPRTPKPKTSSPQERSRFRRPPRWPALQQALYLRQLNVLFDAGIPIHQAANVVGDSDEHTPEVKAILSEIPRDLERGRMLSKCLEKSGLFGRLVVSSVKLGEESGRLDEILKSLAEAKEESVRLRRTLVSRLTYPVVVLIVMSLGLLVMGHVMSRVMSSLPNFKPTDIPLFGIVTGVFQHPAFLPLSFLSVGALGFSAHRVWQIPRLRMALERKFMSIPMMGTLLQRLETNSVTSQLSLLLAAGLPIDRGMELCSELVWTLSFKEALLQAQKDLRAGAELGDCFRLSGLFPDDVLALITAGEMSGQLESSLQKAAAYCSDQVERTLETLLALLEPLLIGFLGISIGAILLCTFVPVFNSLQTL